MTGQQQWLRPHVTVTDVSYDQGGFDGTYVVPIMHGSQSCSADQTYACSLQVAGGNAPDDAAAAAAVGARLVDRQRVRRTRTDRVASAQLITQHPT